LCNIKKIDVKNMELADLYNMLCPGSSAACISASAGGRAAVSLIGGVLWVLQAVLVPTNTIPDTPIIKGHDFDQGNDLDSIMSAMVTSGFQATALGQAINEVNRMVWPISVGG
jgi:hypothetical protein